MELRGSGFRLRAFRPEDAGALLQVRLENRDFLEPFEPTRPESFYTLEGQSREIEQGVRDAADDRAYPFGVYTDPDVLVGGLRLSSVVRGAWHNANLGYFISRRHNGRGAGTEAVGLALRFAFEHARLHRVQAAAMPDNIASIRVLQKNRLRHEGHALRYLRIAGEWRDHDIFAITREEWHPL
jgi:[ribosomal protein S5]-alanine N-acetyltransferase